MAAGAQWLIRDLDDHRLGAVVKERIKQSEVGEQQQSPPRQRVRQMSDTLHGLIKQCPGAIALLQDGVIVDINLPLLELLGCSDRGVPIGQRLSAFALQEDAADLDALLDRAQLLEVDNSIPDSTRLVGTDGSVVEAKLSLYPIDFDSESRIAVFIQPSRQATLGRPGLSIDADTGLPDRNVLLDMLSKLLSREGPIERGVVVVCARMEDVAAVREREGLRRGLRHAAETALSIRSAMPEETLTARICDDACAIVFDDIADHDATGLAERVAHLLAANKTDGAAAARCRLGVAFGVPGKLSASQLLDMAYADSLARQSTTSLLHESSESLSAFNSVAQSIGLTESEPPADAFSAEATSTIRPPSRFSTSIQAAPILMPEPVSMPKPVSMREQADDGGTGFLEDSITASIERALETDGFSIMYQPIISLMGDSQEHYSVLLRLRREHERMLTANELLGPAARAGTLPDVDRWVIQRALEEQAKRRRLGQKVACFLSLSAEIVQDDRLLIWICDALREFEVRGSWVTFQFQERDALSLADKWNKLAEGLKKIKCRICINQFGMQENPELAMTTMGADYVKFAPELAIGLANDPAMQRRLLQLIKMAQDNKVKTIVTGVEDARSLALLWGAGIDYVQGNFLQSAMQSMDTPA
jgi:EAL domain-containing protein (putative c-di-GMP-specific phosphodiesterase class I)/GGDEF domain-containing protein